MKAASLFLLLVGSHLAAADQGWAHTSVRDPVKRHSLGAHKPQASGVGGGQRYLKSQGHAFGGGLSRVDTPHHGRYDVASTLLWPHRSLV